MGFGHLRHPLLLLIVLFVNPHIPFCFSGKPGEVCVSQGGRFPPFSSEGNPPSKASKGPKDLTLCRVFRKKTCCDITQTHPALVSVRRLATKGEASPDCLQLWELLECSVCDPHVGVKPGPPLVCASLCDRVFEACSNAYFSMDANTQVLAPCGVNEFVCGMASEWISNGTEFCRAAGFEVAQSNDIYSGLEEASCYGGKASLDSIADSWKSSQFEVRQKSENLGLEDFQQWVREMPFNERVSWAVGGMVLTAGLLYVSKKRSHSRSQKSGRRLGGTVYQSSATSPNGQGNRRGNRR